MTDVLISVIVITYNSLKWMPDCLQALSTQVSSADYEIIVVDNGSVDGTQKFIREKFPNVRLIQSVNKGFGAGNNLGVAHAKGRYLAFVNPDTIVEEHWLEELTVPLLDDDALVTTSKIVLMNEPLKVNSCGVTISTMGFGFVNHYQEQTDSLMDDFVVDGVSGAAFALSKVNYEQIGGFDEDYFMYMEDVDISCRMRKNGLRIFCVVNSVVRHSYELVLSARRIGWLEKGRVLLLRKHFSWCDLFILTPALGLSFILSLTFAFLRCGKQGVKSWFLAIYEGSRQKIDCDRNIPFWAFQSKIPFELVSSSLFVRYIGMMVNFIFDLNLKVWRFFKIWRKC